MNRSEVLDTAKSCVTVDRQATHGNAEDTFAVISDFWVVYIRHKFQLEIPIGVDDVANMMSLMKKARIIANPKHHDNYIDDCGYTAIAGEIASE